MMVRFPESSKKAALSDTLTRGNTGTETASKRSRLDERDAFPHIPEIPKYSFFRYLIAVPRPYMAAPQGVSIDEVSGHIYMADCYNKLIRVFSGKGERMCTFRYNYTLCPYGVLVHNGMVYVTDWGLHLMVKFFMSDKKVLQVGGKGSGEQQFDQPLNLSMSPDKLIYVADSRNDRLQVLDCDLTFKGSLQHHSISRPVDVKFNRSYMFVLNLNTNPCLKIFTLSGELVRSIITRGDMMQTLFPCFFCLDARNNIIISDNLAHDVKIFSPKGKFIQVIGERGLQPGLFEKPQGIAIMKENKLVVVSQNSFACLQIFY